MMISKQYCDIKYHNTLCWFVLKNSIIKLVFPGYLYFMNSAFLHTQNGFCLLNISYPCNAVLLGSGHPCFTLGCPFIYPAALWAKWEPHVPCYRGSQMKCSSGGWPLTSPDTPLGWPEQRPAGHSGLLLLTTWVCTLDLLCVLQHVHIYTAHVNQLTRMHHRPLYTFLMAATSSGDLFLSLHTAAYKHLPAASRSRIPYMCVYDLWTYISY